MKSIDSVCVIGLGYIGLPTSALFASSGISVLGIDVQQTVVDVINRGEIHIVEPELDVLVREAVRSGRLRAATEPVPSASFLIAVPTPFKEGHVPDLSYVDAALSSIAPHVRPGNSIVLESTSPVGTTERLAEHLVKARPDLRVARSPADDHEDAVTFAYCPERVLPGKIVHELTHNDRVVGGLTPLGTARAKTLYERVVSHGACIATEARTAELSKLAENAYRDVNIAFANELANVAERLGVDVWRLIELTNRHPRVKVLQPGPGVGGHCIAVDPWFIVDSVPDATPLIRAARAVNDERPHHLVTRVLQAARARSPRAVVACLGLSYKADIDDLRESPAVEVTEALARSGEVEVLAVEPNVNRLPPALAASGVQLVGTADAIGAAQIVVLLVDHKDFRAVPRTSLAERTVFDTRGIWR